LTKILTAEDAEGAEETQRLLTAASQAAAMRRCDAHVFFVPFVIFVPS
jgi:hypothetical protein